MTAKRISHTSLISLEGIICLGVLFLIPTDSKNAWLFGFSASRLVLAAGLILASLASLFIHINQKSNSRLGNFASSFLDSPIRRRALAVAVALVGFGCVIYFAAWLGFHSRYAAYFLRFSPVVLFLMFVCAHGIYILRPYRPELRCWLENLASSVLKLDRKLKFSAVIIILLFIIFGIHFYRTANYHAQYVNQYPQYSDQRAYLRIAKKAFETNFQYKGDRKRNPGFPYLLALLYDPGMNEFDFFRHAQQVNIILSLILLAGIFIFTRRFLPTIQSLLLTLIAAGSIYVYRAGYVQPEPLYYFLAYVTFVLMAWMMVKPSLPLATTTGAMAVFAYLVKPSALPSVLFFLFVFGSKILFDWISSKTKKEKGGKILYLLLSKFGYLTMMIVVFLGLLSPYLIENKRIFGQYFYNANTTFFIWYDSIKESQEGTWAHGDDIGWPDMPEDQIPTMSKYLREHTKEQIIDREIEGLKHVLAPLRKPYSRFNYPILLSIVFCLVCALSLRKSFELAYRHIFLVIFILGYFTGYMLSFAWFSMTTDHYVARFTFGLMIPLLFSLMFATNKIAEGGRLIKLLGISLRLTDLLLVIHTILILMIFYDFTFFAPGRLSDPERWYAK